MRILPAARIDTFPRTMDEVNRRVTTIGMAAALCAGLLVVALLLVDRAREEPAALRPHADGMESRQPELRAPPAVGRESRGESETPSGVQTPATTRPGIVLAGVVVLPDGRAASAASVFARPAKWNPRIRGELTTTDASGAFKYDELGERFGPRDQLDEFAVRAVLTEGGEWFGTATARVEQTDIRIQLQAGVEPNVALVRVFAADGRPVPSAEGVFRTDYSWSPAPIKDGRAFFEFKRGQQGEPNPFFLILSPRDADGGSLGSGDARVDGVTGGRVYEVHLPMEAWISGRVVASDHRGVSGARLRAVRVDDGLNGQPAMRHGIAGSWEGADVAVSADDGTFRIGRLGDGDRWILVKPPAEFRWPEPVRARPGTTGVRIALREAKIARVRVLGPEGGPLRGALVRAGSKEPPVDRSWPRSSWGSEVPTDQDGVAVIPHLASEGSLVLTVMPPADSDDLLDSIRSDWVPAETTVRLEPGAPLAGIVQGPEGTPVGYVFVLCREADGTQSRSQADKEGRFRFTAMPRGEVELKVDDNAEGMAGTLRTAVGRRDLILKVSKTPPSSK